MKSVNSQKLQTSTPRHVAIIMDGNGRWAQQRGLPRVEGHRRGADAVKRALKAAKNCGVSILTLYAFSVENWNRPKNEVDTLMDLLDSFLKKQLSTLIKEKIRFRTIGRLQELPQHVKGRIKEATEKTAHFKENTLVLALNYGARTEVVDAIKSVVEAVKSGDIDPATLTYDNLRPHLSTGDLPDPDLIIRTSGELRLSNFLLLQSAYTEIHSTSVLWPDFAEADFAEAIADYSKRERRFGKTTAQLQETTLPV